MSANNGNNHTFSFNLRFLHFPFTVLRSFIIYTRASDKGAQFSGVKVKKASRTFIFNDWYTFLLLSESWTRIHISSLVINRNIFFYPLTITKLTAYLQLCSEFRAYMTNLKRLKMYTCIIVNKWKFPSWVPVRKRRYQVWIKRVAHLTYRCFFNSDYCPLCCCWWCSEVSGWYTIIKITIIRIMVINRNM